VEPNWSARSCGRCSALKPSEIAAGWGSGGEAEALLRREGSPAPGR